MKDPWFKLSIVQNALSYSIALLFDSFVLRQSMNEGTTSIEELFVEDTMFIYSW